jgi:type VI secretion system protein ImpL
MKLKKAWLAAALALALFLAAAWAAAGLGVKGRDLWVLRGGLVLLGIAAAGLAYLYLAARARRKPAAPAAPDEVAEALAAAEARLASAALAGSSRVSTLPVVLLVGPAGSAKTSAVVHSGLEPELLAGEVERAGAAVPTAGVNVWYARETVFLEAGAPLLDDDARWAGLVRHLQPRRLAAALMRGPQAPRVAVVCVGCDELLRPGAADAVPAAARRLRARLGDLSLQLGVRLPVYVLFTRADRVPYFADYVRGMTRDEAREVLGATFRAEAAPDAGRYAELAARRVGDALGTLWRSLALARLDLLPRETREEARGGAYELPREMLKLSELATAFLVELCRPSQLHVSPFLRGFYFSGVRTVVSAGEDSAEGPPPAALEGPQVALGATSVFDPRRLREAAAAPVRRGAAREVAEWVFAPRVFSDVIVRDRVAMAATGGGTRVNALRRALAGSLAAAALVLAVAFTVSYRGNRALLARSVGDARAAQAVPVDPGAPASADALTRLDALRGEAAALSAYRSGAPPLHLRWGLYAGSRAYPALRGVYFAAFERHLWARTRAALEGSLGGLPAEPGDASQYGRTYDDLKAYLITTTHPQHGTGAFLDTVLARHWAAQGTVEPARLALARRQFTFFGDELPLGNPFEPSVNGRLVGGSRAFLGRFAQADAFYRMLLSEAGAHSRDVDFAREYPLAGAVAGDAHVVPGAFTRDGWTYVRGNADAVERLFAREDWVLGAQTVGAADRRRIADELQRRYVADYVAEWRAFLYAGRVAPFGGLADAARKLEALAGNDSPVLELLALVSRHTAVDSARVGAAFQPVHQVVPPTLADRVASDATAPYLVALGGLRSSVQQASAAPGALRGQLLAQAGTAAGQAEGEVRKLAQGFHTDSLAGPVAVAVQALLRAPVQGGQQAVAAALGSLPPTGPDGAPLADPNAAGAHFCAAYRALAGRYPFSPGAAREAGTDELAAVFLPGRSALAELLGSVSGLAVPQGRRYAAKLGATPPPTASFLAFLTAATGFAGALYDDAGGGPEVVFTLRPQTSAEIPEVTVVFEGRERRFTRTLAASESFSWHGGAGEAELRARLGAGEVVVARAQGLWAPFRLFAQGQWQDAGEGHWLVRWRVPGASQPLALDVSFQKGVPVFDPAFLRRLTCVSRIVP